MLGIGITLRESIRLRAEADLGRESIATAMRFVGQRTWQQKCWADCVEAVQGRMRFTMQGANSNIASATRDS